MEHRDTFLFHPNSSFSSKTPLISFIMFLSFVCKGIK